MKLQACKSKKVDHTFKYPRPHSRFPRPQSVVKTILNQALDYPSYPLTPINISDGPPLVDTYVHFIPWWWISEKMRNIIYVIYVNWVLSYLYQHWFRLAYGFSSLLTTLPPLCIVMCILIFATRLCFHVFVVYANSFPPIATIITFFCRIYHVGF